MLVKPIHGGQKSPFHFQARFFDCLQGSRYRPVAMKPTNSQFVPGRMASKTPFLSALTIWLLFLFSCCRPFASARKRLLLRQEHRKARSWRDRWRLISKQRIGRLLKAESPMDFSPFIQTGRFATNFGTRESTPLCSIGLAKRICTVSSIGRASDS